MNNAVTHIVCALVLGAILPTGASAQPAQAQTPTAPRVEFPAASPASTLKQRVGVTDFEIVYSRPGMKGRQVFGGLEPYGKVWRTGANSSTKITFSTPLKFGGQQVAAGTYALFSIPDEKEWTVILNTDTRQWGAFTYDQSKDVLRVKALPVRLAEPVETFTIDINDIRDDSATLNLIWGNTRVPVKLELDTVKSVAAAIEAAMASGQTPPANLRQRATAFYIDHDMNLQQALQWLNEDIAKQPPSFALQYQKARALAKLGDKRGAIEAARKSIELLATQNESVKAEYTRLNQQLIDSLK